MKLDDLGCVVLENGEFDADRGDSCAETGRLIIFVDGAWPVKHGRRPSLVPFITLKGYVRHPHIREDWREEDFTSDQMEPFLMASYMFGKEHFNFVRKHRFLPWKTAPNKLSSISVNFLARGWLTLFAVTVLVQIAINKLPWRWHDGNNGTENWSWFRRKFWRFTSSEGSSISYLTVLTECIFLHDVGIRWPTKYLDKQKYLDKAREYYVNQPNSAWFIEKMELATERLET